jgi:CubicO group peptidase (beta-lactamase class C family)
MNQQDISSICEQASRPYRKRHGITVAGFMGRDGLVLRTFRDKHHCIDGASEAEMLFEIGSITKTFTTTLMCELALRGLIDVQQPIKALLSGFDNLPEWITPHSLATHTSGLPRIPDDIDIADMRNPYRLIDEDILRTWVQARTSFAPVTAKMSYSNLGMGLLGLALGHSAGSDFTMALKQFVTEPLGLHSTMTNVPPEQAHKIAQPHGLFGKRVPVWDFDALAGCGALKSTPEDLARYAQAVIRANRGEIDPIMDAIRLACTIKIPAPKPFIPAMCYGWFRMTDRSTGLPILHHDGGTGGSSATLFICPEREFAVFSLSNTNTTLWTTFRQVAADPMGMLSHAVTLSGQ